MTHSDYSFLAICLWKEARGEGNTGMTAVGCVVRNRVTRHNSSYFSEVVRPWQFSSVSAKGDPQLSVWPKESDPTWQKAQLLAGNIIDGMVQDITEGSTLYYDDSIDFPSTWNKAVVQSTVKIGRLNFFREM